MPVTTLRRLWTCPLCRRRFANRNQSHACGTGTALESHFEGRHVQLREIFDRLLAAAEKCGPVIVNPEKTRIAFQVRMNFAAFTVRTRWVDGHVVLARRWDSPRFLRIQVFSPRNQMHEFRLYSPGDVDAEVESWLAEAYAVGEQKHLR